MVGLTTDADADDQEEVNISLLTIAMKISATAIAFSSLTGLCYSFTNTAFFKVRTGVSSTAVLSAAVEETATYADPKRYLSDHPKNNVPPHIAALVGKGLHTRPNHPIGIIRAKIQEYFASLPDEYHVYDAEDPIVTTKQCFDDLRIAPDHPGRSPSDTYYIDDTTLLRTHTSAHQSEHLRNGADCFLCAGDVYRRDEIDSSHYPAFHQLEGVKLFKKEEMAGADGLAGDDWVNSPECKVIGDDLKKTLEGLMDHLFGETEKKWSEDYFPFTTPSYELEIKYEGEWLEVLGCGVVHEEVLQMADRADRRGWAFGLGLERLAMILFEIPDIRLFWSDDARFHSQFKEGEITKFKSYSKFPPVFKDIAFWIPEGFVENDFFEMARGIAGDIVERMELIDEFTNPKKGKTSKCYRITYRSMDRSLTNEEIDALQDELRERVVDLGVEVR
jgi:phenylalanyl-tRNA synthetase alpha chain